MSHILEINDVSISLRRAIEAAPGLNMYCWLDDDQLARLREVTKFHGFIPDGFSIVGVETSTGMKLVPLFVEVDRQTETVKSSGFGGRDWYSKIERYSRYFSLDFRTDQLLAHCGVGEELLTMLDAPRVLVITKSQSRVERMVEATRDVGGMATYLYTTKSQVEEDLHAILGSIWRATTLPEPDTISLEDVLRRPLK